MLISEVVCSAKVLTGEVVCPDKLLTDEEVCPTKVLTDEEVCPSKVLISEVECPAKVLTDEEVCPAKVLTSKVECPAKVEVDRPTEHAEWDGEEGEGDYTPILVVQKLYLVLPVLPVDATTVVRFHHSGALRSGYSIVLRKHCVIFISVIVIFGALTLQKIVFWSLSKVIQIYLGHERSDF